MSGTITKNLKLKAVLDDQAFRKQLQDLKKELGSVEMGGAAGSVGFDRSSKLLADAAQALRQVADSFKKSGGASPFGTASMKSAGGKKNIENISEEITKNTTNKIKTFFDAERAKYVNVKPGQSYDSEMGKVFRRDMDHETAKAVFKEKQSRKEQEKSQKSAEKEAKILAREKEQQRRKDVSSAKDLAAALGSRTGIGLPMARQMADIAGNASPGLFGKIGSGMRGAGAAAGKFLGSTAGLATVGVGAAAALGIMGFMNNMGRSREFRAQEARQNQELGTAAMQGRGLEGMLLKQSRGDVRGLEKGLSATGGFLSSFNPFSENFATNPFRAASSRVRQRQEGAQEAALAETEQARAALQGAKQMRQMRVASMRGTGFMPAYMSSLQDIGADQGFSGEETLQQFAGGKQFLGRDIGDLLPSLQKRMQMTGMGVEDQAAAIETLMSSRKGTSSGFAANQSFELLKKAVAAGLDVSKSGKFLQTTADFISSTQGLGQLDSDSIAQKLIDSAAGFAGGGPITSANLSQAAQLQEILSKESISQSGLSGLGNVQGIVDALGPNMNTDQFFGALRLGDNATLEDAMKAMPGIDEETAKKVLGNKKGNLDRSLDMLGIKDSGLGTFLASTERGMTAEQQLGASAAARFKATGPTAATDALLEGGIPRGVDMNSLVSDFKIQQEAFNKGVGLMATEAASAATILKKFREELDMSTAILESRTRNKK